MRITIFTPAYNRGYLIRTLYSSLKKQTFEDFEWVVINDGSTDDTDEIFKNEILPDDHKFDIIYEKTPNRGKHCAWNRAVQLARGELFFIVDSDDYLTDDSLEIADRMEKTIPENEKKDFSGVYGLKGYSESEIVGSTYDSDAEYFDTKYEQRKLHNIAGDKAEIFYTDLLKKYPFPEFEGETYLNEGVLYERLDFDGYKCRFFNKIIYICDYLPDGLTRNLMKHIMSSPQGHALLIYQRYLFGIFDRETAWDAFSDYYHTNKHRFSMSQISKHLHQNVIKFFFIITYMRIKFKIKNIYKKISKKADPTI